MKFESEKFEDGFGQITPANLRGFENLEDFKLTRPHFPLISFSKRTIFNPPTHPQVSFLRKDNTAIAFADVHVPMVKQ